MYIDMKSGHMTSHGLLRVKQNRNVINNNFFSKKRVGQIFVFYDKCLF